MKRNFTRVLLMGDPHCGHFSGLVPPDRQALPNSTYGQQQRKMWKFYTDTIKELGQIDICISNGDGIDGKQRKAGGTQLLEPDRVKQAYMYAQVLKEVKAKEYYVVVGTPYHCGEEEDFEKITAEELNCELHRHLMLKVRNSIFDIKHKVGGGRDKKARVGALASEKMSNMVWAYYEGQPDAQFVIRSHIHDFNYIGDDTFFACTLPGLEGFGDKFGVTQCSGIIKIGLVWIDVFDNKEFRFDYAVMKFETKENGKVIESRLK